MTMVREDDWKLVHFVDCIEGQLFDLATDPDECNNLWDDPQHAYVKERLLNAILEWRIESGRHTQGFVQMLAKRFVAASRYLAAGVCDCGVVSNSESIIPLTREKEQG